MFKDMHSALDLTNKKLGHLSSRLQTSSNFTSEFATHMVNNLAIALQFSSTCFKDIFDLYREFENVSAELRYLETGLASLIQGHLSPHLITFDLAKDVLDMVASRLRKPLEHLAITSAQEFDAIEDFYIQRKDNTLHLGIHIPVTFNSGCFHLYQINSHPLPAAMNSPNITYIKDAEEYLAQSTDRRFYFHPRQQDLFAHCIPGDNKICSYRPPWHDASQQLLCEYAIFINSENITEQTCQYSIQTTVITPDNPFEYYYISNSEYIRVYHHL